MNPSQPNTVRLQRLARTYRETGALLAAVELGLFSKISEGANTGHLLVDSLAIRKLNAERLINACLGLGLIIRKQQFIENAPDVERFLVRTKPTYAGEWMFFTHPDWDKWGQLAGFLREKSPPELDNKTIKNISLSKARRYHGATFTIGRGAGRQFLRQVDLTSRTTLLDIGGGSGAYCIDACKKYPKLTATVLDLP